MIAKKTVIFINTAEYASSCAIHYEVSILCMRVIRAELRDDMLKVRCRDRNLLFDFMNIYLPHGIYILHI